MKVKQPAPIQYPIGNTKQFNRLSQHMHPDIAYAEPPLAINIINLQTPTQIITPSKERSASIQNTLIDNTQKHNSSKMEKYSMLGGLGPNIGNDEWEKLKKKQENSANFAKNVELLNKEKLLKQRKKAPPKKWLPIKGSSNREKALAFAKRIPKPTIENEHKLKCENDKNLYSNYTADQRYLELESMSEEYKKQIEEIKRQMSIK